MNALLKLTSFAILLGLIPTSAECDDAPQASLVLAAMADGIGDLTFASAAWVEAVRPVIKAAALKHQDGLKGLKFTLCEVGHNPPAYLKVGDRLAWYARFNESIVSADVGELANSECTIKIQGDHSILSNLARIQYHGNDPTTVTAAQSRLRKLSKWVVDGNMPDSPSLRAVLRAVHDSMAARTMPRFVFMTPEWVNSARYIISTRAKMPEFSDSITDVVFKFSEEFTHTPKYAFPDGSHGGFWVHANLGAVTVGSGPLPAELGPADYLTKGKYTPVVPVGRTVNASMTDEDKSEQASYSAAAFKPEADTGEPPIGRTSPSGREFPPALGGIMATLHDELGMRTSGELPADYDQTVRDAWASAPKFDRNPSYDPSWVLYDRFDIYGNPRR